MKLSQNCSRKTDEIEGWVHNPSILAGWSLDFGIASVVTDLTTSFLSSVNSVIAQSLHSIGGIGRNLCKSCETALQKLFI